MSTTKAMRPAGPAQTPSQTSMTVLTDPTLQNPHVPTTFLDGLPLPRMMVFDLDYTLWPFWCDTHCSPPLKSAKENPGSKKAEALYVNNKMVDRWGEQFGFYQEVPAVLSAARDRGIILGIASRTHTPDIARDLLKGLTVPVYPSPGASSSDKKSKDSANSIKVIRSIDMFHPSLQQIYPNTKTVHFRKILEAIQTPKVASTIPGYRNQSVEFADMLFFDDEPRNRNVETELGVTFWLVKDGVSKDEVDKGVWEWRRRMGLGRNPSQGSK